ncbi:hypothetical protein FOA52_009974 [Chlamydomonas sp. UWO 241]|nr:hypothetical protein FOA52_009974 [Chlamydomonas sp. UWO 241]
MMMMMMDLTVCVTPVMMYKTGVGASARHLKLSFSGKLAGYLVGAQNLQRIGRPLDAESTLLPVPKSTVFTTSLGVAPRGGTLGPGAFNPDGTVKAHTLKSLGTKGARSLALRNRDWTCSEALQQHAATYAKNLRKLYPHDPDQRSLLLTGQALETQLESLAYSPIVLEEVEALLAHTEPEAFAAYAEVKMRLGQEAHAAYEAELAAQEEAAAAAAAAGPQPGPHVRLPVAALALTVGGGNVDGALQLEKPSAASAIATFSLVHRGTAAFRYTWEPVAPSLPPFSAAQASTPPGFNPPSGLSLSQSSGALLPGETAEFGVVFRPPNGTPGVYTQAWALVTQPPLAHSASEGGPIVFTATGLCTPSDESGEERRAMADELAVAERTRKVHAALNRVLADITPPPPPRRPEPIPDEVAVQQAAFDAANAGSFPPVFYSPEAYAQLEALYGEAMGALAAACAPAEDAVPAKGKAAPKKGKDADPPPPSARAYPDQWDASLSSLSALIHDVWKAGAPPPAGDGPPQPGPHADAADAMRARLAALAAAAKVPPDARVLLRHAARAMLVSVVEAMVDKLAGVESEYSTRLSEQEAVQAEAVEAAGGGDPPALPPGSVDSVWRSDRLRAEAKKHLKGPGGVAAGLFDAVGAGRVASGDALMLTLAGLDARIEAAAGSGSGSGDGEAVEGLQWERFAALRHWGRLGVPARPPYVLTGEAGEPEGKVAEGGKGGGKGAGGAKLKAGVSPAKKGTPKKGTAKKK